jgi:hypothetical protein
MESRIGNVSREVGTTSLRPSIAGYFKHKSLSSSHSISLRDAVAHVIAVLESPQQSPDPSNDGNIISTEELRANVDICRDCAHTYVASTASTKQTMSLDEVAVLLLYSIAAVCLPTDADAHFADGLDFNSIVNTALLLHTNIPPTNTQSSANKQLVGAKRTSNVNQALIHVSDLVWLMLHALAECPTLPTAYTHVYRYTNAHMEDAYTVGSVHVWRQFASCVDTCDIQTHTPSPGTSPISTVFRIELTTTRCRDISQFTLDNLGNIHKQTNTQADPYTPREVVFPPNTRFKVINTQRLTHTSSDSAGDAASCVYTLIDLVELWPTDPIYRFGELKQTSMIEPTTTNRESFVVTPCNNNTTPNHKKDGGFAVDGVYVNTSLIQKLSESSTNTRSPSSSFSASNTSHTLTIADTQQQAQAKAQAQEEEKHLVDWLRTHTHITVRRCYEYAALLIDHGIGTPQRLLSCVRRHPPMLNEVLGMDLLDSEDIIAALAHTQARTQDPQQQQLQQPRMSADAKPLRVSTPDMASWVAHSDEELEDEEDDDVFDENVQCLPCLPTNTNMSTSTSIAAPQQSQQPPQPKTLQKQSQTQSQSQSQMPVQPSPGILGQNSMETISLLDNNPSTSTVPTSSSATVVRSSVSSKYAKRDRCEYRVNLLHSYSVMIMIAVLSI